METVGSLCDKLAIGKIREANINEKLSLNNENPPNSDTTYLKRLLMSTIATNKALEDELDELVAKIAEGSFKSVVEPKNKMYYSPLVGLEDGKTIANYISDLFEANRKLWELEDMRRDKGFSDIIRLRAADNVADQNQIRNMCIDKINDMFDKMVNKNN